MGKDFPIVFEFRPKNKKDGEGFSIRAFDLVDEDTSRSKRYV
jgi:hypothetical protein